MSLTAKVLTHASFGKSRLKSLMNIPHVEVHIITRHTQPLVSSLWNVYGCNCCSDYGLCELKACYYIGWLMELSNNAETLVFCKELHFKLSSFLNLQWISWLISLTVGLWLMGWNLSAEYKHLRPSSLPLAGRYYFPHHAFKTKICSNIPPNIWLLLIHFYPYL